MSTQMGVLDELRCKVNVVLVQICLRFLIVKLPAHDNYNIKHQYQSPLIITNAFRFQKNANK